MPDAICVVKKAKKLFILAFKASFFKARLFQALFFHGAARARVGSTKHPATQPVQLAAVLGGLRRIYKCLFDRFLFNLAKERRKQVLITGVIQKR